MFYIFIFYFYSSKPEEIQNSETSYTRSHGGSKYGLSKAEFELTVLVVSFFSSDCPEPRRRSDSP